MTFFSFPHITHIPECTDFPPANSPPSILSTRTICIEQCMVRPSVSNAVGTAESKNVRTEGQWSPTDGALSCVFCSAWERRGKDLRGQMHCEKWQGPGHSSCAPIYGYRSISGPVITTILVLSPFNLTKVLQGWISVPVYWWGNWVSERWGTLLHWNSYVITLKKYVILGITNKQFFATIMVRYLWLRYYVFWCNHV